ncbi:MAG: FkbM family methyltransferase, partial [Chloroflexota bacterium]|nr:FkbM family methyltransferase [Chloroflexota bacterium]
MPRDSRLEQLIWRFVTRADRILGIRAARSLTALVIRVGARSPQGWAKGVLRVAARHVWSNAPALHKVPERWWRNYPVVRVQRLGLDIELDLRDNLQRILYYTGTYEPQVLALLRRHLRRGDVFVDVGANVGVHALTVARHFQRLGGGRVFAFEPAADAAARLRATARANHLDVAVVEVALGREQGKVSLFGDDRYDPADFGVRSQYGSGRPVATVSVVPFDAWAADIKLDRLDAVKIDVEGGEGHVIEGMRESLRRLRPRLLVVELKHSHYKEAGA